MRRLCAWLSKCFTLLFKPVFSVFTIVRALWSRGPWRIFQQLGRLFVFIFWGVIGWCASLNYRLLLQGLPALAGGVIALAVLGFALFTPAQEIESRYVEKAQTAVKAKDYAEAVLCYERLAHLQGDRPEVLYDMAVATEAAGQPERCAHLMHQLAPADRQGYPKAHLWQAVRLLTAPNPTQQKRQLAETHLLRAIEGGVEDKGAANGLLGDIYLTKGLLDQAEPLLLIAVKNNPKVRLRLALLYALRGNLERSRAEAKLAIKYFSNLAKADLFAHYHRLRWAEATTFLEEFPQAVAILQEGLTGTGEPAYRVALAQTYATWFDHLSRQGNTSAGERLALLEIGLRHDPKNLAILDRLLTVTGIKQSPQSSARQAVCTLALAATAAPLELLTLWVAGKESEAEAGAATLRRLLAQGQVTAQVHFALGVYAHQRGEFKEARYHWERAHQLDPDVPTVANNLAWLLLQTSPDELPKALELINLAIDKAPRETNFRGTRGHILAKMGKYREAIVDLETALPLAPNSADLHRTMADVYGHLDLPRMAAEHERLASEKSAKKETRPRR